LRVEGNKSGSTFYNKSYNAILLAIPNLWGNIQIIRTCILKHNVSNPVSLATRHLDIETLHCCFEYASDKVMYHVLNNIKNVKKICFPIQKCVCYNYILRKMYQCSFSENLVYSSKPLELTHSDLLELTTLSYSKYKWVITFLDDYSFYCNITLLYKNSEAAKVIKSIFWI